MDKYKDIISEDKEVKSNIRKFIFLLNNGSESLSHSTMPCGKHQLGESVSPSVGMHQIADFASPL